MSDHDLLIAGITLTIASLAILAVVRLFRLRWKTYDTTRIRFVEVSYFDSVRRYTFSNVVSLEANGYEMKIVYVQDGEEIMKILTRSLIVYVDITYF